MDELEPRPIPGTEDMRAPVVSPDGTSLAFSSGSGGAIYVKPFQGGPPTEVVRGGVSSTFGADGMLYYRVAGSGMIWRYQRIWSKRW